MSYTTKDGEKCEFCEIRKIGNAFLEALDKIPEIGSYFYDQASTEAQNAVEHMVTMHGGCAHDDNPAYSGKA